MQEQWHCCGHGGVDTSEMMHQLIQEEGLMVKSALTQECFQTVFDIGPSKK